MKSSARNVKLASLDDLFSTQEEREVEEVIVRLPLSQLHAYKGYPGLQNVMPRSQPYLVREDDPSMQELVASIKIRIYGLADGFVFANLTILFVGMAGVAGIGLVILIMVLASFSAMAESMIRGILTFSSLRQNKQLPFVPHILSGYLAVTIALSLYMVW